MRIFLAIACAMLALVTARAEYLYWQVTGQTGYDASYAMLYANGAAVDGYYELDSSGSMSDVSAYNISALGGLGSFYIELLNSTFVTVATSETKTYAQLSESIGTGSLSDIPRVKVWHGGKFSNVPEPTGALLVLFGVGLLALRRGKSKGSPA